MVRSSQRKPGIIFWCLLIIIITARCQISQPPFVTPQGGPSPTPTVKPINLLIEGDQVLLNRYPDILVAISPGMRVLQGDRLKPQEGQLIKVLCSDLTLLTIDKETPCSCSDKNILKYEGYTQDEPMGADSPIPYVLFPRKTPIMSQQPVLQWNSTGASSYSVEIRTPDGTVFWKADTIRDTQIQIPANKNFADGVYYRVIVTDNDKGYSSKNDPIKGIEFYLIEKHISEEVKAYSQLIQALDMDQDAKTFTNAVNYAAHGLYGEALLLLDQIKSNALTPAMQLWRGHMYAEMQLSSEAEAAYSQALDLAENKKELYLQAEANGGLWCVTNEQMYYDAAVHLYEKLKEKDYKFICEN